MAAEIKEYPSERFYIESATSLVDRLKRIYAVIDCYESQLLAQALEDEVVEFRLDDGQTKINVQKRGIAQMTRALDSLEKIAERFKNKLNGRGMRLVDFNDYQYFTDNVVI